MLFITRDHSFSKKFSKKLTFITLLISKRMLAYQGVRNVSFSKKFAEVLNEWSPIILSYLAYFTWRTTGKNPFLKIVCGNRYFPAAFWHNNSEELFFRTALTDCFYIVSVSFVSFIILFIYHIHWVKECQYSELFYSAFFRHFSEFRLNTERYSVSLCIQSECRKTREKCGPK